MLRDDDVLLSVPSAQTASIEEVTVQKSAFEVYKNIISCSGDGYEIDEGDLKELFQRQLDLEQELNYSTAVESITHTLKLTEMGKSSNLISVQRILLEWYEPFVTCLDAKIEALGTMFKLERNINSRANDKRVVLWKKQLKDKIEKHDDLTKHGPILTFLPSTKLAVITMNAVVNHILSSGNNANAASLCKDIAEIIETEVNLAKTTGEKLWVKSWQKEQVKDATGKPQIVKALGRQIRKYYDLDSWDIDTKLKVGGALVEYLKSVACVNGIPALVHEAPYISKLKKKVGFIRLTDEAFKTITEDSYAAGRPKFLPMLVPPTQWRQENQMRGGYLIARTPFLRYRNKSQLRVLQRSSICKLLEGLDYLGSIPWKINSQVFDVIKTLYAMGEVVGEIPTKEIFPLPTEFDCLVPKGEYLRNKKKKMGKFPPNELSNFVTEADDDAENSTDDQEDVEERMAQNFDDTLDGDLSDNEEDCGDDEMILDKHLMKYLTKKIKEKNQNNHSLRCDIEIKLSIAERFKNDRFYFPWNIDFRGRAYPVPPNLSHMGSDLCRGILTFAEPKPLGPNGLEWLKCHLCNLFGYNKTNFATRVQWSDDHIDEIFDSATNPIKGKRFWATSENPFQSLATCFEIYNAIKSGNHENYMCCLPVHQDGSCNGLQHYAALGRDKPGAQAVNLLPSDHPQDVYSEVLNLVLNRIERDILIAEDDPDVKNRKNGTNARFVHGHVNRKILKQTVMTSVYGVTLTGARMQIMGKLKDKIYGNEMINKQQDDDLFSASHYLASITITSLGDMFSSANQIMDWLAKVAMLVAAEGHAVSWTTPLGLPVMQPYVKRIPHTVKTLLQSITLSIENDALPVSAAKQKSAFPPNYVHSLDSTHMLMTGLRMKEKGLSYTAVHDSYWTHACDVDKMNSELRDCFINLYNKPLLEDLKNSLELRYPNISIPPIPDRGKLNLEEVKNSRYFFH